MKPSSGSSKVSASGARPFLGYNFCSAIQGHVVPQRVQNLCIRDYAATKKLVVGFSASEYTDTSQSLILFAQFENLDQLGGFVFYSLMLLPPDDTRRRDFFARVTAAGKPVHFALEDLVLSGAGDIAFIERMYRINLDTRLDDTRQRLIELHKAK